MTRSLAIIGWLALAQGCEVDPKADAPHGSVTDRQDAAMKDPFSYGPNEGKSVAAPEPANPKRDDSFKGDWNRVMNP